MLEYLTKYDQLPINLRREMSRPEVIGAIKNLENKYQTNLGQTIMQLMVKEVAPEDFVAYFIKNLQLTPAAASQLTDDLKRTVFAGVKNYLYGEEIKPTPTVVQPLAAAPVSIISQKTAADRIEKTETEFTGDIEKRVDQVIDSAKLDFASDFLATRFRQVLKTYLKGIRDKIAAREVLLRAVDAGGLGFDINSAEAILTAAKSVEPIVAPIKRPAAWELAGQDRPLVRDVEYNLAASLKARQAAGVKETPTMINAPELMPPPPAVFAQQLAAELPSHPGMPEIVPAPAAVQQPKSATPPPIEHFQRTESGKIRMDDIKSAPRVFTPVDELKYMTIKNFRNLGEPRRATEIIKKKIEALGEEDFGKKVAGIQGWKESPVNRLYVEVYRQAMERGKPVEIILSEQRRTNPEALSETEFEAILSFNQELRGVLH